MIMTRHQFCGVILFLVLFFPHRVYSYEKTLRKIVRNQSKMVQRPFSDTGDQIWSWNNQSRLPQLVDTIITAPEFVQNKMRHRLRRPTISNFVTSVETGRGKAAQITMYSVNNIIPNDLRLARNTLSMNGLAMQPTTDEKIYNINRKQLNNTPSTNIAIETYSYKIPTEVKFFPPIDDQESQSLEQKNSKELTVVFPETLQHKENGSVHLKSIFVAHKNNSERLDNLRAPKLFPPGIIVVDGTDEDSSKADFFLHISPVDLKTMHNYNASINPYICKTLKVADADIDAQKQFAAFDIEPPWVQRKHFWNSVFDSRYESLMRNAKWPPLKVILVPRSHVDSIWKKSFEQYHNDSVSKILANMIKKMHFYTNLTFAWNEVSHLSRWWKNTSHRSRAAFRKMVKSGRLEITTGGWVEPDEATTHIFGLIHQLIEGHEWLKIHLNYSPKVAWLTNSVTHSPTMTYLLSTLDISQQVLTNLHFSWEQFLAEYQYSDFIWLQNWDSDKSRITYLNEELDTIGRDRYLKHSVITHYLQFNSAGFKACGPNKEICSSDFNFAKSFKNLDINSYNVKEKSESLLEQYSKSGTITPHNTIIAPIGGPYTYESQTEFDYQYNNYQKIADFVNVNQGIYKATIEFGTPKDYFKTILSNHKKYPTLKGDFLNFADIHSGTPAYWTGFYTSRPFFKILLRRLESTMRSTEILLSFALSLKAFIQYNETRIFETIIKCREKFARLMDRNVASGTLPANVLKYAHTLILTTIRDCWHIQEVAVSRMTSKRNHSKPYLQKYVFREGEFISTYKTVSPEDQLYIFNSFSHERTEIIELMSRHSNLRIMDYNKKEVTVQINPIWKYNFQNVIKISRRFFKIIFAVTVPPMTIELFKIKKTYDATESAATIYCSSCKVNDVSDSDFTFPFNIQPVQTGDIQLESYKHRLIFDETSGFLKTVVEKETNIAKTVIIDFGAFRDADVNSGMFLFNTNVTKPLNDILMPYRIGSKTRISMIISGRITTEISSVFGRFLQHTIKIYNLVHSPLANAIQIESKVDYEISPKHRDLELFMSIQTDIANGVSPQVYIDNNGFQHTARLVNLSRRVESNLYPITSMAYIQDHRSRLTYITDHAQGLTALQEGQLVVMLDRRVLFNDGRGANEGLADSGATCHTQFILLENFKDNIEGRLTPLDLSLPSFSAVYLANALNYPQDVFLVHQNSTEFCHYGFLPLIKSSFPCDISVINFRIVMFSGGRQQHHPNTALLILHRQSFSCRVDSSSHFRCNGDLDFPLDKIFRNWIAVYQTNLAGTDKGTPLFNFGLANFSPMEITTLRVYF